MSEMFMIILKALVVSGLICFVVNQAIKDKTIKQKLLFNFVLTVSFLLLFGISFIVDSIIKVLPLKVYLFLALPFVSLWVVTTFVFLIIYFNKYKGIIQKRKEDLKESLYIVIKYNNFFYLEKTKLGLKGITIKISKSAIFHDEMLNRVIKKGLFLQVDKQKYLGSFTEKNKIRYRCYLLVIKNEINKYQKINQLELMNQEFLSYHKEVILKIILNKEINDEY